jgi:hypothetical protein
MLMRRQFDLCDPVLATQHGSALVFLGGLENPGLVLSSTAGKHGSNP